MKLCCLVTLLLLSNCLFSQDCGEDPILDINSSWLCGQGEIILTASLGSPGVETGTFLIMSDSGPVEEGVQIALENNSCEPITFSFTAQASCADGSIIPGQGNEFASITVYPKPWIIVQNGDGGCGTTSLDLVAQNGSICENGIETLTCEAQGCIPAENSAAVNGTFFGWTSCPQYFVHTFQCSCEPLENCCPTDPILAAIDNQFCGSGELILAAVFGDSGSSGSFTVSEASLGVVDITSPISLPANETCSPINYVFTASAICEDGSIIPSLGNESVEISVYPANFSAVQIGDSQCGESKIDLVAQDGTICSNFVAAVNCIEPQHCLDPPSYDSSSAMYTIFSGSSCEQFISETVECNCPPPECLPLTLSPEAIEYLANNFAEVFYDGYQEDEITYLVFETGLQIQMSEDGTVIQMDGFDNLMLGDLPDEILEYFEQHGESIGWFEQTDSLIYVSSTFDYEIDQGYFQFDLNSNFLNAIFIGIEQANPSIKIYPIPAQENLHINSLKEPILQYQLFDNSGNEVLAKSFTTSEKIDLELNLKNIPSGFYLIHLKTDKSHYVKKVIKL